MDVNKAILYGQLVNAAYDVDPADLTNQTGRSISAGRGPNTTVFEVITSIYANDLATDLRRDGAAKRVSMGLILRAPGTGEAVIAIRGTEGILEWMQDAKFLTVPCRILPDAGETEDGFTAMYDSLAVGAQPGSPSVVTSLATVFGSTPPSSLTVCGHSLGGALATLLALDVAANSKFKNPSVYTYASPRTGNRKFAKKYNQTVPNTFRIANRVDLVPRLPLFYKHVQRRYKLSPIKLIPPRILVEPNPVCEHVLPTYLHLLSMVAGGKELPLRQGCNPTAGLRGFWRHLAVEFRSLVRLAKGIQRGTGVSLGGNF